jgi:hypothetical protein
MVRSVSIVKKQIKTIKKLVFSTETSRVVTAKIGRNKKYATPIFTEVVIKKV